MTRPLPLEIIDFIVDYLHDKPESLKACCLVSKAWIPRTRKYLFARMTFHPSGFRIRRWRKAFPDPSSSPAHFTRALKICDPDIISPVDAIALRSFRNVVSLDVDTHTNLDEEVSLRQLHAFSPSIKSLSIVFNLLPISKVFALACSFPLLEDLALVPPPKISGFSAFPPPLQGQDEPWNNPSVSPRFTGSLELCLVGGTQAAAQMLLELPNGLHFKEITVTWSSGGDVKSTIDLVSRCSRTLESLKISNRFSGPLPSPAIDLSKAKLLREVAFRCEEPNNGWIVPILLTVKIQNIQQISLDLHRAYRGGWSEVDSLLVKLCASHSIKLKIGYQRGSTPSEAREFVESILPQVTRSEIVETEIVNSPLFRWQPSQFWGEVLMRPRAVCVSAEGCTWY